MLRAGHRPRPYIGEWCLFAGSTLNGVAGGRVEKPDPTI